MTVEAQQADLAEAQQAYARAKDSALRMLAAREHSVQELQRKLIAKRHADGLVSRLLAELQAQDLLSDARFAESYVRSRTGKGFGPMRIRQGLFERGIGDELVEQHLTHCAEHWLELASQALLKRFKAEQVHDRNEWNRRARFLAGRGYPADIIYQVLGHD
jgi:regulatory protein